MCEFCTSHGEGKEWYLNVRNYSAELLNDPHRKSMIRNFYKEMVEQGNNKITRMEQMFQHNPKLLERIRSAYVKEMKSTHFGQVLPLEDVGKILTTCNTAVRLPCGCRWAFSKQETRVCFGISFGAPEWFNDLDTDYFGSPDVSKFDHLHKEQVLDQIRQLDGRGLVHSVWTFQTPFIGAICNCELKSCLAMRSTIGLQMPLMFRSEKLAEVDAAKCRGCRECGHLCQFGAVEYSEADNRSHINWRRCFGCGVCRAACSEDAITLVDRKTHPFASSLW
ncbi:MAG: 4Fe-4S dicluster domain-containing protein [Thermodesulfovibrionales bacterium]